MRREKGVSLVELIIFIIMLGIIASMMLAPTILSIKKAPELNAQFISTVTANSCIEYFIGQRQLKGFDSITLSTETPAFCINNTPAGFNTTVTVTEPVLNVEKLIVVETKRDGASVGSRSTMVVTKYE